MCTAITPGCCPYCHEAHPQTPQEGFGREQATQQDFDLRSRGYPGGPRVPFWDCWQADPLPFGWISDHARVLGPQGKEQHRVQARDLLRSIQEVDRKGSDIRVPCPGSCCCLSIIDGDGRLWRPRGMLVAVRHSVTSVFPKSSTNFFSVNWWAFWDAWFSRVAVILKLEKALWILCWNLFNQVADKNLKVLLWWWINVCSRRIVDGLKVAKLLMGGNWYVHRGIFLSWDLCLKVSIDDDSMRV